MTAKKISELAAGTALTGTELVPVVQGGVTVQATAQEIADLGAGGDAASVTYAPADATDWTGSTDPGNVDDALDQLASRTATLEAGGGGSAGKHAIPVMAAAIQPSATGGCQPLAKLATSANRPDVVTLDFDATTQEYAQFALPMPKSWNEGTITFKALWSHGATTTNFGVAWALQAVAISNDDTIDASYGTAVVVTDTGGTTNDLYVSNESSAITIAGTPAAEDVVYFRVYREVANGSDNMAIDARLHGIVLYITTDASTDA